jgi:NAD(P)-dependent dehydrogenase (short-subunit alcohol dehydrogenase family)
MDKLSAVSGVALVTGGASGIGEACCVELARRGAKIAMIDLNPSTDTVAERFSGRGWIADVCDEPAMERVIGEIEAALGPIQVLVNSAGILQRPLPPGDLGMETWDDVMRVDLRGTYLVAKIVGERMAARHSGAIVNIASITGWRSTPLHAYGPAKAAVIALTANLAAEWGPSQVRVNAVAPGFTATPALLAAIQRGERDPSVLAGNAALGRLVETAEVARVVGFLAAPESSAITGTSIAVDCGWLVAPSWATYGGLRKP